MVPVQGLQLCRLFILFIRSIFRKFYQVVNIIKLKRCNLASAWVLWCESKVPFVTFEKAVLQVIWSNVVFDKAKGRISKRVLQEKKQANFSEEPTFITPFSIFRFLWLSSWKEMRSQQFEQSHSCHVFCFIFYGNCILSILRFRKVPSSYKKSYHGALHAG